MSINVECNYTESVRQMIQPLVQLGLAEAIHEYRVYEWIDDHHRDIEAAEYTIASGASRYCIIHPDYSFVVKFQVSDVHNYCQNECAIYNYAVEHGCADAFAWIRPAGFLDDIALYACEFCDVDSDEMSTSRDDYLFNRCCAECGYDPDHLSLNERRDVYKYFNLNYCASDDGDEKMWIYATETWGEKLAIQVQRIVDAFDINDLHSGNFGWRGGQLVMTDYAGYGRDCQLRID